MGCTELGKPRTPQICLVCFSVIISFCLAQGQACWICSHCSPFTSPQIKLLTPIHQHPLAWREGSDSWLFSLSCCLAVNSKQHWLGSLQTPWCSKGRILSGLSDHLSAGWFSVDFLAALLHSAHRMDKPVLAHRSFISV